MRNETPPARTPAHGPHRPRRRRAAPQTIKHRITGLFESERAEGTFSYDPKTYSFADFGQWMHERTFQIKPASATPADKLTTIKIAVLALDCKGCCFAMHNFLINQPGVEQATPDMKQGTIAVLIDPTKTNQAALETALKKRDVQLKEAPKPVAPK